jgi:[ribosomal protein S5]-alanine N-acetyltransferase
MIKINTGRLIIRNFVPDDWEDFQAIIIDKESSEYAAYDHQFPISENEVKRITAWFAKGDDFLAVYELVSDRVIGYLALYGDTKGEKNFGYTFHSAYQKKGCAIEACTGLINYAFNTMLVERLISGTANINQPSCKLLAKLGFRKTGESVTSFRKTPEGKPIEFVGSSFLLEKEEWLEQGYSGS